MSKLYDHPLFFNTKVEAFQILMNVFSIYP